jgi:hypothetical protein
MGNEYTPDEINRGPEPPGNLGVPGNVPPGNLGARGNAPPKRGLLGKFQEAVNRLTGSRGRNTRDETGNTRF